MNSPDVNKRLKGLRIPIEVCIKYERLAGFKSDNLTHQQKQIVGDLMIDALTMGVKNVVLTSRDYELISKEVKQNEEAKHAK